MTQTPWDAFGDRARARRAAARSLHPDVGGDADLFTAALAAIDRRFGEGGTGHRPEPDVVLVRPSRRGSAQAWLRAMRLRYRSHGRLPLGRRRYLTL